MNKARKRVAMLCYPYDPHRLETYQKPYIVQPKLDGIRCYSHQGVLTTSEGNVITILPEVSYWATEIQKAIYQSTALDGELYVDGWGFQRLVGAVKRKTPNGDTPLVRYRVFDYVPAESNTTQEERQRRLDMLSGAGWVDILRANIANSHEEILDYCRRYVEMGYEGVIVRNPTGIYKMQRSTDVMKLKPRRKDEYIIVGTRPWMDKDGSIHEKLGSFQVVSPTEPEVEFSVGTGMTESERLNYWEIRDSLIGRKIKVLYQELSDKGVPRFPVVYEVDNEFEGKGIKPMKED